MTKLFHISDIHFGREDKNALRAVEHLVEERKPDGIVVSGDLTQKGKKSEFVAAASWLSALNVPFVTVPGNHDTPMFDVVARLTAPFLDYRAHFSALESVQQLKDITVAGLNSARGWQFRKNWAEGSIDLEALESLLAETGREAAGISLLTCHHPFLDHTEAPLRTRTSRGKRAAQMLARSRTNILLAGHVHKPNAEVFMTATGEGYLSVLAGTLSTRLRDHPPSLNELCFQDDHLTITAHSFTETAIESSGLGGWNIRTLNPC